MAQHVPHLAAVMRQINTEELAPMAAPNPKAARAVADGKAPLDYLESAVCDPPEARVLATGAAKYGRRNFRDTEMLVTTYVGAIRRHLNAWASGEDLDPDSGELHLAHIRACTAVVLAAADAGTLKDDRHFKESLPASDAVHIDGDLQAKTGILPYCTKCGSDDSRCWRGPCGSRANCLVRRT